jgi:hypothetical protein
MANARSNKPYGHGRVQFLARLSAIRDDLAAGLTLRAIHAKHRKIDVTYSAFAKLIARYASTARPSALPARAKNKDTPLSHERKTRQDHSGTVDAALLRKITHGE